MSGACPVHGPVVPVGVGFAEQVGHVMLVALTCGLWTPLALLAILRPATCPACGRKLTRRSS